LKTSSIKVSIYSLVALLAFAANSVLCRLALYEQAIDPASFTLVRLMSGAITLLILVFMLKHASSKKELVQSGDWTSASALFVYAAGFSFAYIVLPAGLGALLLFGSVQVTMMLYSLLTGERLSTIQWLGFITAIVGLVYLLFPDSATIQVDSVNSWLVASLLMIFAGIAWGIYSIKGKKAANATLSTTDNFLRASLMAIVCFCIYLFTNQALQISEQGLLLALISGAITSGMGYAIWYAVLPSLKGTSAASMQLSVPVFASLAGVALLGETLSISIIIASMMILGGVGLVIKYK
jgi:drug/metabolite transporter (DMT)-like permease